MKKQLLIIVLGILTFSNVKAQLTTLMNFNGTTNGGYPLGDLISDGTYLYGMTYGGGAHGDGTVFKIKPDGTGYTDLLDFAGTTNGQSPYRSLYYDGTYLYGMTRQGGANSNGTIFKIKPDGTGYVKLLDFNSATSGSQPCGSLIYDDTYLYGMTELGGANNDGTIFKIKPDGTGYLKLLDFTGTTNGQNPYGSLYYDGTSLYGMTKLGGTSSNGTIFKIMPDGTGYNDLLNFTGSTTIGMDPFGTLISDGTYLYGMTGGSGGNYGNIFKIKPDGTSFTNILSFTGIANGSNPHGDLYYDGTYLYGMTYLGGANNLGTIFRIEPDGTNYTDLVDFAGTANGQNPGGNLISDGTYLYGMTYDGGANTAGVIFKLCLPITVIVNSGAICSGQSFTMAPSGASTYTYSSGSAVVTPSASVSYSVTGTNTLTGCASSSSAVSTITVNTLPTITAVVNTPTVCVSIADTLTVTGATSYTWSSNAGSAISNTVSIAPTINTTYTVTGTDGNGCINNDTVNVVVTNCTGIKQYATNNSINVYPNPTTGSLQVAGINEQVIQITDVLGNVLISSLWGGAATGSGGGIQPPPTPSQRGTITLDVSALPAGVYFIKTTQGISKFVKE